MIYALNKFAILQKTSLYRCCKRLAANVANLVRKLGYVCRKLKARRWSGKRLPHQKSLWKEFLSRSLRKSF